MTARSPPLPVAGTVSLIQAAGPLVGALGCVSPLRALETGIMVREHHQPRSRSVPLSSGLSHVAMSVPEGTLTDEYRTRLLGFYGRKLGWREMESLRLPDRLTVAVGRSSYINIRERPQSMVTHGYEHFGVLLRSAEDLQRLWEDLANGEDDVQLERLSTNDGGEGSFRFRFLLPMAVEAQFFLSAR